MIASTFGLRGYVRWELLHEDGTVTRGEADNLITQVGDQLIIERAIGLGSLGAPTGMKLGTGSTTPSKTGAGAALVNYLGDSHLAFDATYPQSTLNGAARRGTYKCTYVAGKATSAGVAVTEAVIVNNASLTDATSTAANTASRVLLTGIPSKEAGEQLTIFWTWDGSGS